MITRCITSITIVLVLLLCFSATISSAQNQISWYGDINQGMQAGDRYGSDSALNNQKSRNCYTCIGQEL